MASTVAEQAVRNYLLALHDPAALRDERHLDDLRGRHVTATDPLERLRLSQDLLAAQAPAAEQYEPEFVTHASAWAQDNDITAAAFTAEGVPADVLRRAGLRVGRTAAGKGGRGRGGGATRSRVSSDEVRKAIPKGTFTIRSLQDRSGASPQVVRAVVKDAVAAGTVTAVGTDPDHAGPGRQPTLYKGS